MRWTICLIIIAMMITLPFSSYATEIKKDDKFYVNLVKEKYLSVDNNNNFSISDSAVKEIPSDVLVKIKKGMSQINSEINDGTFFVNKELLDVSPNPEKIQNLFNKRGNNFEYKRWASKYDFGYAGFDAYVNKDGTTVLINDLEFNVNIFLLEGAVAAAATTLAGVAVMAFGAGVVYSWLRDAKNGKDVGKGSIVQCWGTPSTSAIYDVDPWW